MSYIWIISITDEGETRCYMNMSFKTKHKSKVGKYIRKNISQFVNVFSWIKSFGLYGSNVAKIQEKLEDFTDMDEDDENVIEQLREMLEEFSDEEIVDEINLCADQGKERSITIIKVPAKETIIL